MRRTKDVTIKELLDLADKLGIEHTRHGDRHHLYINELGRSNVVILHSKAYQSVRRKLRYMLLDIDAERGNIQ